MKTIISEDEFVAFSYLGMEGMRLEEPAEQPLVYRCRCGRPISPKWRYCRACWEAIAGKEPKAAPKAAL